MTSLYKQKEMELCNKTDQLKSQISMLSIYLIKNNYIQNYLLFVSIKNKYG